MFGANAKRMGLVAMIAVAASACASTPDAFARHDRFMTESRAAEAAEDRGVCPVVLSNTTDQQLDARYTLQGVESMLGRIPAGRSLSFRVGCRAGSIEASAVSSRGGLLGGGYEYRTTSRIDPAGPTQLKFTVADRVR